MKGDEMEALGYRAIDADQHYFETDDCFTRYIEPKYRERAIHLVPTDEPNRARWALGDKFVRLTPHNLADSVSAPGSFEEMYAGKAALTSTELIRPRDIPALMQREPRYELMDAHNIQAQILLPTLGLAIEHDFQGDVGALCANYRSFNLWLEEDWGFGEDGRNFSVPMITLLDVDWAVEETERVASLGCPFVYLKTGPVAGRSPADPVFDRFWRTVEETGVRVVFHIDTTEFNDLYAKHWSEDPDRNVREYSPLQWYHSIIERPIMDTVAALLLHNLFGRFPEVQIMTIEHGGGWVRPLLRLVDKAAKIAANGCWLGGPLQDLPSDILPNHLSVSPYYEDDIRDLIDLLGVDRVHFGSDYPHPEGLREPMRFLTYVKDLTEDELRMVMRDNTARLLGLPVLETV